MCCIRLLNTDVSLGITADIFISDAVSDHYVCIRQPITAHRPKNAFQQFKMSAAASLTCQNPVNPFDSIRRWLNIGQFSDNTVTIQSEVANQKYVPLKQKSHYILVKLEYEVRSKKTIFDFSSSYIKTTISIMTEIQERKI